MIGKQLQAEKQLAIALDWTNLVEVGDSLLGTPPGGADNSRGQAAVPRWTRDWSAGGTLITGHDIDVMLSDDKAAYIAHSGLSFRPLAKVYVSEHSSKDAAALYAITVATAAKLNSTKDRK